MSLAYRVHILEDMGSFPDVVWYDLIITDSMGRLCISTHDRLTHTGGSSAGLGAITRAMLAPIDSFENLKFSGNIGVGTDSGGSARIPAAICGTFGEKVFAMHLLGF